jgi:hypothetical protein
MLPADCSRRDAAMVIRMLRKAAWPALLAALIPAGCNSPPASAQVLISSYIQGIASSSAICPFASQTAWINIGVETGNSPTTVADQGNQGGGQVSASCTVRGNGSNFDIQLNASLSNTGSITIVSNSPISPTDGGMGVTGTFESGTLGRYTSNNCTIKYSYNNGKVPVSPPIAGGRIWGHLSCLDAQRNDLGFMVDGGTVNATCDTEADFLFENCAV